MTVYQTIECTCGWRVEDLVGSKRAQVVADRHESQYLARRAYRHDTTITEEVR